MTYTEVVTKATKNGDQVELESVTKDTAYCQIRYASDLYRFPVDLSDIGTGTLKATDKAIFYSRFIRKAMEDNTFIKV